MQHRLVRLAALVIAIGALTVGLAVAATGGSIVPGDDREAAITGAALERASAAALAHTGGGRVTETEAGDEDGYYEVEVTLEDGSSVDSISTGASPCSGRRSTVRVRRQTIDVRPPSRGRKNPGSAVSRP